MKVLVRMKINQIQKEQPLIAVKRDNIPHNKISDIHFLSFHHYLPTTICLNLPVMVRPTDCQVALNCHRDDEEDAEN